MRVSGSARPLQFISHHRHRGAIIEQREPLEPFRRSERLERLLLRDLEKKVKVIAHQAISHDPDITEILQLAEDRAKDLLFTRMENDPPVHHS